MNISLYYLLLTLISPLIICRWTQDEKEDNDSCKEDMTLTDQDGNDHCFEKDSDEEVEVKCVEDDNTTPSKEGEQIICFQNHVSKMVKCKHKITTNKQFLNTKHNIYFRLPTRYRLCSTKTL